MSFRFIKKETPFNEGVLKFVKEQYNQLLLSKKKDNLVFKLELNGIVVLVSKDSNPDLLVRDQQRAYYGLIPTKIVGPYSEEDLGEKKNDLQKYLSENH